MTYFGNNVSDKYYGVTGPVSDGSCAKNNTVVNKAAVGVMIELKP
jgi:hypothetical protein